MVDNDDDEVVIVRVVPGREVFDLTNDSDDDDDPQRRNDEALARQLQKDFDDADAVRRGQHQQHDDERQKQLRLDEAVARALLQRDKDAARQQPAKRARHEERKLSSLLDLTKPAQSLRGVSAVQMDTAIGALAQHQAGFKICASYCFKCMLEREQDHAGDYICFYHAYNHAALIYEVQATIARVVSSCPHAFAPLTRLLKGPFQATPTAGVLVQQFPRFRQQDHTPAYRAVAICVSLNLFGFETEAPPINLFGQGYNGGDPPNYRKTLAAIFGALGFSDNDALIDDLAAIGTKYKLSAAPYARGAAPGVGPVQSHDEHPGHLLQIFVRRSIVNDVVYPSLGMGIPITGSMVQYVSKGPRTTGQARLLAHPDTFLREDNNNNVKVFHYAATPSLCSPESSSDARTRGNLLAELEASLRRHGVFNNLDRLRQSIETADLPGLNQPSLIAAHPPRRRRASRARVRKRK